MRKTSLRQKDDVYKLINTPALRAQLGETAGIVATIELNLNRETSRKRQGLYKHKVMSAQPQHHILQRVAFGGVQEGQARGKKRIRRSVPRSRGVNVTFVQK